MEIAGSSWLVFALSKYVNFLRNNKLKLSQTFLVQKFHNMLKNIG